MIFQNQCVASMGAAILYQRATIGINKQEVQGYLSSDKITTLKGNVKLLIFYICNDMWPKVFKYLIK